MGSIRKTRLEPVIGDEPRGNEAGNRREYLPERATWCGSTLSRKLDTNRRGDGRPWCLSPRAYNAKTSFGDRCPIRIAPKGYPFEVALPSGGKIAGVCCRIM